VEPAGELLCWSTGVFLKNRIPVSGFLIIRYRKDLLSPWLFIIADTKKYVLKGEIHS
jgi:hypothetical protein